MSRASLEMDLVVAAAAIKKARDAVEDNADAHPHGCVCGACPLGTRDDAGTLRLVYSHLLTASAGLMGAIAMIELREELRRVLEGADTERPPSLRVVR